MHCTAAYMARQQQRGRARYRTICAPRGHPVGSLLHYHGRAVVVVGMLMLLLLLLLLLVEMLDLV